ncbi:MAG: fused MFS/spermidine synthase [Myxococcales bacterium]|nr:fused MFS/spermidine synthase [Myxococcales bacterium]
MGDSVRRAALLMAVTLSGACGLTWELLWQHHAALALGLSSAGTAITLAALMAGLGLGALLAARLSRGRGLSRPMLAYALAELAIGLGGWLVPHGFSLMASLDTQLYATSPALAAVARVVLTALVLLAPAVAMGATIPILVPYAAAVGSHVAMIYALNTLGAVLGILATTFILLPTMGVAMTGACTAGLNLLVAAWALSQRSDGAPSNAQVPLDERPAAGALVLAAGSGMAVFMLEVSWFRSMRAAFQSSTETFAAILAAFLLCLSLGAWLAPHLRARTPTPLSWLPALSALAVLATTPAVDRIDQLVLGGATTLAGSLGRMQSVVSIVAAPITLLGLIFPSLLMQHDSTSGSGRLLFANTVGAVLGALAAGFLLLPTLGATHTSWLAALLIALAGVAPRPTLSTLAAAVGAIVLGGIVASLGAEDAASQRVQGPYGSAFQKVLHVDEGPDSTLWVTEEKASGARALIIDGFLATSEGGNTEYMEWMGHLPALAAARLDRALVICFGTGRTAHAVWQHGPARLNVVDISRGVLRAAHHFPSNRGVLKRANVFANVMDGRAYLRRSADARFDLITLEPMPPNFAGVNNLYSTEFYRLAASRLSRHGVLAQWLPYHLISTPHMRSIVAAFHRVFAHSRLWHDPTSGTGILLGAATPIRLGASQLALPLSHERIETQFMLDHRQLGTLSRGAAAVSDDNQLLSYGPDRLTRTAHNPERWSSDLAAQNLEAVRAAAKLGRSFSPR